MSKSRGSRDPPCPFLGAPMLETWIRWRSVAGESRIALGRLRIACEQLQQLDARCARAGFHSRNHLSPPAPSGSVEACSGGDALNELPLQDVSGISYGESSSRTRPRERERERERNLSA